MKNEFEGEAKIGDLPLGRVKVGIDMASGPSRTVTRGQFAFSCTFTMDTSRRENRDPYIVRGNILYRTSPRLIPIGVALQGIRDNRLRKFVRRGGLLVEVRARRLSDAAGSSGGGEMIFSIINPSDCFTMEADDLKVAQMAAIILGGGMYGLSQGGQTVLGIPQTEQWLKENFGNHTAWLDAHIDALIAALDSVKLDGERSSMNCIDRSAQRFAQQLRERKEARGL